MLFADAAARALHVGDANIVAESKQRYGTDAEHNLAASWERCVATRCRTPSRPTLMEAQRVNHLHVRESGLQLYVTIYMLISIPLPMLAHHAASSSNVAMLTAVTLRSQRALGPPRVRAIRRTRRDGRRCC